MEYLEFCGIKQSDVSQFIDPDGRAFIDWVQGGLDVVGLIPGVGEIADGANGVISLCRGDELGAALSFGAMIPFAGWVSTGSKAALKYGDEAIAGSKALIEGTTKAVAASSEVLAKNMGKAGIKRPLNHAAHHIVAGNSKKALEARGILEKFKIGINDAINGVFLPTQKGISDALYHPSLHTDAYYTKVNDLLREVTSKEEAIEVLKSISEELSKGTF